MPVQLMSLDYAMPKCDTRLMNFPILVGHAADCDIQLLDHSVADHHCEVDYFNGSMFVRDLGSIHGTFVNGRRVSEADLEPGDRLSVGMLTFLVQTVAGQKADRQSVEVRRTGERWQNEPLVLATA